MLTVHPDKIQSFLDLIGEDAMIIEETRVIRVGRLQEPELIILVDLHANLRDTTITNLLNLFIVKFYTYRIILKYVFFHLLISYNISD